MDSWKPISRKAAIYFFLFYVGLCWLFWQRSGFVPVLDDANLLFHDAGHALVGFINTNGAAYGGIVAQLVFPLVVMVHFWRQRETLGIAIDGIWLADNFFNIARYMADARADQDTLIAGNVKSLAWFIMALCGAWVAWQVIIRRNVSNDRRL